MDLQCTSQKAYTISGVPIIFPYKAYPAQIAMMTKVIKCLKYKHNALLESPTGTGKTLALLCSTIGWLKNVENHMDNELNNRDSKGENLSEVTSPYLKNAADSKFDEPGCSKDYCTQKVTAFHDFQPIKKYKLSTVKQENQEKIKLPKIYFGTRTHKQISQNIRELKKTPYKNIKMNILSSREKTCIHPETSTFNKTEFCHNLIYKDDSPGCRFYSNLRRAFYCRPPEMESAFDLEDFVSSCKEKQVCPYFGARELLPSSEIVFCPYNYLVDPLIRSALSISLKGNIIIIDEAHNIENSAREAASGKVSIFQIQQSITDVSKIKEFITNDSETYLYILKILENLKKWLENVQNLNEYVTLNSSCKVWSGHDMISVLNYVGLGPDTYPLFRSKYCKIVKEENEKGREKPPEAQIPKLTSPTHICLKTLNETLNYLYKDNLKYVPDYRCVVMKSETKLGFDLAINFWCLNPAVAFSDLNAAHSIIISSGTLAPLTSFQSELGIPFEISLEANHVIRKEQIWAGSISKGPNNISLSGNFKNATTVAFQDDVGKLVLQICSLIAHGILCFFPSYTMMDKLVNRWQISGLYDELMHKKVVLCETRQGNAEFTKTIQDFYDAVLESENDKTRRGAIFFAVCRGKVSEGLDFADNKARAVITIGIPFPNIENALVDLKKKYNDMYSSKRQIMNGSVWYEMQAFRALNQALGRCIRHKDDFGALIIVDERFQLNSRYTDSLSKWIKDNMKQYSYFEEAFNSLNEFVNSMNIKDCSEMD